MQGFVIFAIVVILLTAVALVGVTRLRRNRVERRLRVEVSNEGNVRSRYELRAEDPAGVLGFRFALQGAHLAEEAIAEPIAATPQPAPSAGGSQPKTGKGVGQAADQALGIGGAISGLLLTVGTLLPDSMGRPVMNLASTLRGGQIKAARIRSLPGRARGLKPRLSAPLGSRHLPQGGSTADSGAPNQASQSSRPAAARAAQAGGGEGQMWVQTPVVPPGETLALDLTVRSVQASASRDRSFKVISRCIEQANAEPVVQEGWVHVGGGFWARPLLPYLTVVATAIVLLLAAYWLVSV